MNRKVLELIRARNFQAARAALLEERNPVDAAAFFDGLEPEEIVMMFRLLPKKLAAQTFSYMVPEVQEKLLAALTDAELRPVLESQFMDDTVDMLEEMPANVVRRVLKLSAPDTRRMLNRLLQYEEGTAGSMMTTEYVALKKGMTIRQAMQYLKRNAVDSETIYTCYVTGPDRVLEGVITVREMLLADDNALVGDVMEKRPLLAATGATDEEIGQLFQKYDMLALPIVDGENRLVGMITVDDAVDAIQEANTEDFEKMAALEPSETPYLKTSAFTHARKRVGWLLFLMLSGIITGRLISHYEEAFAALPILVSFIPMLMDTGGNCGSQSATLVIRGMALEEIRLRDLFRVMWKECRVSLLVGAVLAPVNLLWIWLCYHSLPVGITVGLSMMVTIFLAKLMGCLLPMLAKRCRLDPALMASPLITTVVDACSIFVYFNIALRVLRL